MTPLAPPFGSPRSGRKSFVPRRPILGTISDLVATPGDGQVVLTFTAPVGGSGYLPQFRTTAGPGAWTDAGNPEDPAPYPPGGFTVSGLTNDTSYDFRVIAHDPFTTTTSNEDSATPTSTAGFGVVNDLAVKATQTDTTLEFEWTQVADDLGNPAKYAVRIRTPTLDSSTWGEVFDTNINVDTNLAIGVAKSVQFTDLTAGTDYEALLIPFRGPTGSADAFGDFSNGDTGAPGTTTGSAALGTISDLVATPGDTQVTLNWSPAANATSHQPQYKLSSSGTWLNFGSALGAGASSVTVTGLTNDSSYDFRVQAGDGATTTNSNVETTTPTESVFPNEPAGMTTLSVHDGNVLVPSGWAEFGTQIPRELTAETDATTPQGDNTVLQRIFPANTDPAGRGTHYVVNSGAYPCDTEVIYIHFWFKWSDNWYGNDPSATNKIVYWGHVKHEMFVKGKGIGTGNLHLTCEQQGGVFREFRFNSSDNNIPLSTAQNNSLMTRGQWHRIEIVQVANTADGVADGELFFWMNGQPVGDFTDGYEFFHEVESPCNQIRGLSNNGIWGGQGTVTFPEDMFQYYDGIYVSGKPRPL